MIRAILALLAFSVSVFGQQGFGVFPPTGGSGSGLSAGTLQSGQPYILTTTSASGTTYTATGNPTLTAYAKDQVLTWDVGATLCTAGAITINIDALGAKSIFEADGSTNPVASDCTANRIVRIAYDGAAFRIVGGGIVGGASGITQLTSDVTAGPGSGSQAATIAAAAVTLGKMANLAASSIIGNNTGAPVTPIALTTAQTKSLLAVACADLTNAAASCATDATNATNIGSGNLALVRLPSEANATFLGNTSGGSTTPTAQTFPISATVTGTNANGLPVAATTTGTGTTIPLSVSPAFTGTPTAPTPAATDNSTTLPTTAYVTTAIANAINAAAGRDLVTAASAAVLPNTPTYSNGVSGIGATLTSGSNVALVVDGYTCVLNDRILVKNQASAFQNGIYYCSQVGTGILPWILTRAIDYDTPSDMNNTIVPVANHGTANALTSWIMTSTVATVGTDAVTFAAFTPNGANIVTAASPGAGIARFPGGSQQATSAELSGGCTTSGSNVVTCIPATTAAQTGTYQVLASDFPAAGCGFIPISSGTFTVTLVASGSQPGNGRCLTILNYGTGVITLARSGQNINGAAANLTGTAGSASAPTGWKVVSDGTNYDAVIYGGGAGNSPNFTTSVTTPVLYQGSFSAGNCGTAVTINPANGDVQTLTLSAASCAVTFTQPSSTTTVIKLMVTQAAGANDVMTWVSVKWPGGIAPVMTATASAVDWYSCLLDGTNTYCTAGQNFQ